MRFPRNRDVTVKPAVEAKAPRLQTTRGSKRKPSARHCGRTRDVPDLTCSSHTYRKDRLAVSYRKCWRHVFRAAQVLSHSASRRCGKTQVHVECSSPKNCHSHSTSSFFVIREHALTSTDADRRPPPADECWIFQQRRNKLEWRTPSMYRRPACPVNDKGDGNLRQTRQKRWQHVEEVRSFMLGS